MNDKEHRRVVAEARINGINQAIAIYRKHHDYEGCLEELEALKDSVCDVLDISVHAPSPRSPADVGWEVCSGEGGLYRSKELI